jgi:hypothetical protein
MSGYATYFTTLIVAGATMGCDTAIAQSDSETDAVGADLSMTISPFDMTMFVFEESFP